MDLEKSRKACDDIVMPVKNNRLEDYSLTQLFPIDIFSAEKNKTLAVGLCFFKIGRFFSHEDIGHFKVLQKNHEKDLCSQFHHGKPYTQLSADLQGDVKKLLNKRACTPTRESPYIKFLCKSILKSLTPDAVFATHLQEITESWCFSYNNIKYDLTLNKDKFSKENLIFIDSSLILDRKGMIRKNAVLTICGFLPVNFNQEKVHYLNNLLNEQRDKMVFLYSYKEESQVIEVSIKDLTLIDSKK
jgi:hypothetical protein